MNILNGLKNFLELIEANWTTIMVIIGLIIGIVQKTKKYFGKSKEEKIAIAKAQAKETILKLVSDAEEDYIEWNQAGTIKRSQVIADIFTDYPILSKVVDQEALIKWIDDEIDKALVTLRQVIEISDDEDEEF